MAAENGSNGAWTKDVMTQRASALLLLFLYFVSLPKKGWETQEIRRFVVFVAALTFLKASDKMLN